jgi:hypothetical protein
LDCPVQVVRILKKGFWLRNRLFAKKHKKISNALFSL